MEEVWKDIQGYEGYYQVSNLGRVKSLSRQMKLYNGGTFVLKGFILKLSINHKGYLCVKLSKQNASKSFLVHRLVAKEFIPFNDSNKNQINHIDGVKTNNIVSNLEWCNNSENQKHSILLGLKKPLIGRLNGCSKGVAQYDKDYNLLNTFESLSLAAKNLNGTGSNISKCCLGKRSIAYGFVWKFID